jgi:hypothetical protein
MSISWSIMESVALSPAAIVRSMGSYLEYLTGHHVWTLRASGHADGRRWSWPLGSGLVDPPPTVSYAFELTAELAGLSGMANVDSDQEIEDDGSAVPGHAYVQVTSARDQVSVVVGVAVALGIFNLSQGEFSGTGFDMWYRHSELDKVLRVLGPDSIQAGTIEERISRVARVLRVDTLPVQWG